MSILLKDIPTPKEPTPITIYPDGRWYDYTDGTHGTWIKLPKKHGRLIDADALIDTLEQAIAIMKTMFKQLDLEADDGCLMELKAYRDIRDGIKELDAILEAEGAEE